MEQESVSVDRCVLAPRSPAGRRSRFSALRRSQTGEAQSHRDSCTWPGCASEPSGRSTSREEGGGLRFDVLHAEALGDAHGLGGLVARAVSMGRPGAKRECSGVFVPGVGNPGERSDAKVLLDGVIEVRLASSQRSIVAANIPRYCETEPNERNAESDNHVMARLLEVAVRRALPRAPDR